MKWPVIVADPPWHFPTWSEKGGARGPKTHYKTQGIDWIHGLRVADVAADDCVLLLWACWPLLYDALSTIDKWGFTFKTLGFDWVKTCATRPDAARMGLGYWTRSNSEPCLLATRGTPKRIDKGVAQIIDATPGEVIACPLGRHSEKPYEIYERVERLLSGPYLELFARPNYGMFDDRPNWTRVGNEITGRDMADDLAILAAMPEGNGGDSLGTLRAGNYCAVSALGADAAGAAARQ